MPETNYFPRTITGETDLKIDDLIVDDLTVDGVATIPNLVVPAPTFATLTLTSTSGTSFTVNSTTQGSAILDNSAVFKGGVGIVKGLTIGQILKVQDTTASTSKTTGAVQVAGGIGVLGQVSANSFGIGTGALISSNGTDVFINALTEAIHLRPTTGSDAGVLVNRVEDFYISNVGSAIIVNVNKTTNLTTISNLSVTNGTSFSGDLVITSTTETTSMTTGSIITAGGIGAEKRITARSFGLRTGASFTSNGDDVFINANIEAIHLRPTTGTSASALITTVADLQVRNTTNTTIFSINKVTNTTTLAKLIATDTTAATSTTTGAVQIAGGLGVAGKMYSDTVHTVGDIESGGYDFKLGTIDNSRGNTGASRAMVKITGGILYINYGNDFFGGVLVDSALSVTGATSLPNVTASTSTTTGALKVTGGVGIVGNLSGSTAKFYDTTDSTSATTGSVTFVGGIGVQQRIHATSYGLKNTTITSTNDDFYITASTSSIYLKAIPSTTNSEFVTGPVDLHVRNTSGTIILLVDKTTNITTIDTLSVTNSTTILGASGNTLQVNSTTDSTSAAVGSIRTLGGIAVGKKIYAGDLIKSAIAMYVVDGSWTTNGNDIYLNGTNGIFLRTNAGGTYEMGNTSSLFFVRDSTATIILELDKSTAICTLVKLAVSNTTASTSVSTGAAILQGGLAINKNTNAVSTTNGGSLTSNGGFGFAQDGYIGGNTYITGSLSCSSINFTNTSGTFTPTIDSDTTVTYTNQLGYWYTIGKMVFITLRVRTTSVLYLAAGQTLSVAGLPFSSGIVESQIGPGPLLTGYALPTSTDYVVSRIISGATNITFAAVKDNLDDSIVEAPTTAAVRTIRLSMTYRIT